MNYGTSVFNKKVVARFVKKCRHVDDQTGESITKDPQEKPIFQDLTMTSIIEVL